MRAALPRLLLALARRLCAGRQCPAGAGRREPGASRRRAPRRGTDRAAAALRLRAAYTSETAAEIPLWWPNDTGLFAKHGLDVAMERVAGGSSKAVQVMVAGELEVAQIGGAAVVDARLAGADLLFIATLHPVLALTDLRGARPTPRGRAARQDRSASRAPARSPISPPATCSAAPTCSPETEVGLVQTGGVAETLAAMQSANVPAGVLSPPFDVPARKLGFHELVDVPGPRPGVPASGRGRLPRTTWSRNEDALRRFMRATVEAIARIKQDKALAKQIIAKYSQTDDDEAAGERRTPLSATASWPARPTRRRRSSSR